jgi:purine nucleosidase
LLQSLVSMGGSYATSTPGPEWNVRCDPHAAAQVFAASIPVHRLIGLDVTSRVRLAADEFLRRCEVPALRPVADMAESWFGDRSDVVFHDPLAAATVFEPDLCTFAHGEVTVDTSAAPLAGSTDWRPELNGRHVIAVDVRPDAFFDHYFGVVR